MADIKRGWVLLSIAIFLIEFVSAQYYGDLSYFLENDILRFMLLLLLFFALVFFSLIRTVFKENRAVSIVVAFIIAFFAASSIFKSSYLTNIFGDGVVGLMAILFFIIAVLLLLFLAAKYFKCAGFFGVLIVLWFILKGLEPSKFISGASSKIIGDLHKIYTTDIVLIIFIIGFVICLFRKFMGGKGRKEAGEGGGGGDGPRRDEREDEGGGGGGGRDEPGKDEPRKSFVELLKPREKSAFNSEEDVEFYFRLNNPSPGFSDSVTISVQYAGGGEVWDRTSVTSSDGSPVIWSFKKKLPFTNTNLEFSLMVVFNENDELNANFGPFWIRPKVAPSRIRVVLDEPSRDETLVSGATRLFKFRFVDSSGADVSNSFRDRFEIFFSINGGRYLPFSLSKRFLVLKKNKIKGPRLDVDLILPVVDRDSNLRVGIKLKEHSDVEDVFGPFRIAPEGTPSGEIKVKLLSPSIGSELPSGSEIPFEFKFENAPVDFQDEIRLYSSIDKRNFEWVASTKSKGEGKISLTMPIVNNDTMLQIAIVSRKYKVSERFGSFVIKPKEIPSGKIKIEFVPPPVVGTRFNGGEKVNFNIKFVGAPADFRNDVVYYDNIDNGVFKSIEEFKSGVEGGVSRDLPNVNKETTFFIGFVMKDEALREVIMAEKFGPFYIVPRETPKELDIELLSPKPGDDPLSGGTRVPFRFKFVNSPIGPIPFKKKVFVFTKLEGGDWIKKGEVDSNIEGEISIQLEDVKRETTMHVLFETEDKDVRRIFGPFIIKPREVPSERDIMLLSPAGGETLVGGKNAEFSFRFKNYDTIEISKISVYYKLGDNKKIVFSGRISQNIGGDNELGEVVFPLPNVKSKIRFTIGLLSEDSKEWLKTFEFKIGPAGEKKRKVGAASFDLSIGGRTYSDIDEKSFTTDLRNEESSSFSISNGGSGGILFWRADSSKGLNLSKKEGKLKARQRDVIIVRVESKKMEYVPHVTIFAKRGVEGKAGVRGLIENKIARAIIKYNIR